MFHFKENIAKSKVQKLYTTLPSKYQKYIDRYVHTFMVAYSSPDSWIFDKNEELRSYAKSDYDFNTLAYLCVLHTIHDIGTNFYDYNMSDIMYDFVYALQYCKGFPHTMTRAKFVLRASMRDWYKLPTEISCYFGDFKNDKSFENYLLLCGISLDWIFSKE